MRLWLKSTTHGSLSPTLVNDFGYGVSRLYIPLTSNTAGGNYPSKAGLHRPPGRSRRYRLP